MHELAITAVILAGGRSRRMGMQNKGLLPLAHQPLVAHVIERLTGQVPHIVLSANDNLDAYRQFGLPVIPDRIPDYPGPLGGIYSVLHSETCEWLITAPCDTPYLPLDYVQRMRAAVTNHDAYVAHDGVRLQAGCCLLHRRVLPQLEQALAANQFAVYRFLDTIGAQAVDFSDDAAAFINLNTPDELARLQPRLKTPG
jgi:molybdopterin-guanine dinucleotide biosynthesis protein A